MSSAGYPHLQRQKGQIQVIFGPMFSGKTTELIRRLKRYQLANHKCLIIKYAKDERYETDCGVGLATHDHQSLPAVPAINLSSVETLTDAASVIGIDEGQFFPDIVQFVEGMANAGKIVIVAALDGTYQRSGFGNILNLIPLAEYVIKLTAVCMRCYGEAAFTQRIGQETQVELIGGQERYMAVCRDCYRKSVTSEEVRQANYVKSPLRPKSPNKNGTSPVKIHCPPSMTSRSGKENFGLQ